MKYYFIRKYIIDGGFTEDLINSRFLKHPEKVTVTDGVYAFQFVTNTNIPHSEELETTFSGMFYVGGTVLTLEALRQTSIQGTEEYMARMERGELLSVIVTELGLIFPFNVTDVRLEKKTT
jgi:hypothetical protein